MPSSQSIQNTYDRFSSAYDFICRPLLESGREKAVEILRPRSGEKILEIGIGTGLSLDFYPEGINLTAFDYSMGMLKESRKKLDECRNFRAALMQMDVQKMAFTDNSFDCIIAAYVLTVVEDTEKAVEEIFRVSRPGARVVLINHLRSANKFFGAIEDLFHPIFSGIGLFTLDRDLLGIIRKLGAENLRIEPSNLLGLHHVISFTTPKR
ncbi:MAG: methyltransferase domain-containing protein [Candidatus Riflebacteria bacterium]